MAQAIKQVKGVLKVDVSYRKKAAFVDTRLDMCNAKGAQAVLDGLQKNKKYKGKIFSIDAIKGKAGKFSVPVPPAPTPRTKEKPPSPHTRLLPPVVPGRRMLPARALAAKPPVPHPPTSRPHTRRSATPPAPQPRQAP